MLSEARHNYPEGYKDKPWCPSSKLVQICASLAGMKLAPETFCTETTGNAHYSGIFDSLISADFYPSVSCLEVNRELVEQLKVVKKTIKAPSDEDAASRIAEAKDMPAKSKIFESYKKALDKYEQRKTIVDRWRKVVFKTSISTTSDEKNDHFRQFKSVDELTEEEIVDKVTQFISALNEITGYTPNVIRGGGGAINCPKSPQHRHVGPYFDL